MTHVLRVHKRVRHELVTVQDQAPGLHKHEDPHGVTLDQETEHGEDFLMQGAPATPW